MTKAEYRILHELQVRAWTEKTPVEVMGIRRDLARRMLRSGMLSKRAFSKGYIAATSDGRRRYMAETSR